MQAGNHCSLTVLPSCGKAAARATRDCTGRARHGRRWRPTGRLPALWQARIEQFAEQVAGRASRRPARSIFGAGFCYACPPLRSVTEKTPWTLFRTCAANSSPWVSMSTRCRCRLDQLDLALRAVPGWRPSTCRTPRACDYAGAGAAGVWEPRLFAARDAGAGSSSNAGSFLLVRARVLGGRQGLSQQAGGADACHQRHDTVCPTSMTTPMRWRSEWSRSVVAAARWGGASHSLAPESTSIIPGRNRNPDGWRERPAVLLGLPRIPIIRRAP